MPTILMLLGWRFFFYANEGSEPPHIHVKKGEKDAKIWLLEDLYDIKPAYFYNCTPKDIRTIRRIIFQNFDVILTAWKQFHP